jgi:hypothetical protein
MSGGLGSLQSPDNVFLEIKLVTVARAISPVSRAPSKNHRTKIQLTLLKYERTIAPQKVWKCYHFLAISILGAGASSS